MFDGFTVQRVRTQGGAIHLRRGGGGDPILLLHGYPQTHAIWHHIAPRLARKFTVIVPDLRGYGDSDRPASDPLHVPYSKRAMAAELVEVMRALGHDRFAVVGHDRGARVAYRMALDHPQVVTKIASLDVIPTLTMWATMDWTRANRAFHWLFLIQSNALPERMIGANPTLWLDECLRRWSAPGFAFAPEALAEYRRCFADPAVIHATCEDYRAGATIDVEHDKADYGKRRIAAPLLALWGEQGLAQRAADPLTVWREWAADVRGGPVRCGHFLPEEAPEETASVLEAFL